MQGDRAIYRGALRLWEQGHEPWIEFEHKDHAAVACWTALGKLLPATRNETFCLLNGFIAKSTELLKLSRNSGNHGVAQVLTEIAKRSLADPAQKAFFTEMADLFAVGKDEVARTELAAYGSLLLVATFLFDKEEKTDSPRDGLANLFAVENNRVSPLMSFANWLDRLGPKTGYTKDKMLLDGFVRQNAKAQDLAEQDPRNLLRNPRRYRTGAQVPSYAKAKDCLLALRPELHPDEVAKWNCSLEQREFGLLFVLLVANSAHSIKKIGGIPERPCQAVFDLVTHRVGQ